VLLSDPEPPDALFCGNDHMALAAIEVARFEFGLKVPQDLSIVGFDDVDPARWASFSLTSFSQPVDGMVESAVDLIAGLVEDPSKEPRHEIVEGELVVRGSARLVPGCVSVNGRLVWRGETER
jgi:DNA-binding LacI/PurR family transcriptional regulator